jgi:hypothetical protein
VRKVESRTERKEVYDLANCRNRREPSSARVSRP